MSGTVANIVGMPHNPTLLGQWKSVSICKQGPSFKVACFVVTNRYQIIYFKVPLPVSGSSESKGAPLCKDKSDDGMSG